MSILSRYLVVRFIQGGIALYLLATFLVWLIQLLRLFDLVTEKGQNLFTLMGQAFLTTPPLSRQIVYICMGIGLAQAFSALQNSHELHTIHIGRRIEAIWSALLVFCLGGALLALFISNWAEPASRRITNEWTAQIAVDLLSQSLSPRRFTEIAPGVVIRIGGRQADGTITDFFADDRRDPNVHRAYIAQAAEIVVGNDGFQISLQEGRLQITPTEGKFSEIEFTRYDLAIDKLTDPIELDNPLSNQDTLTLIQQAMKIGQFEPDAIGQIQLRMAEGLRVISLCLLIAAYSAFPHGRRRRAYLPPELVVLSIAIFERSISDYFSATSYIGQFIGPSVMLVLAILLFIKQLYGRKQSAIPTLTLTGAKA